MKIFANDIYEKGLVSGHIKSSPKSILKRQTTQLENGKIHENAFQ